MRDRVSGNDSSGGGSSRRGLEERDVQSARARDDSHRVKDSLRSCRNASNANRHDAVRHVLARAIPSRIAASSTSTLTLRSALNLMQYPVTLALPSSAP